MDGFYVSIIFAFLTFCVGALTGLLNANPVIPASVLVQAEQVCSTNTGIDHLKADYNSVTIICSNKAEFKASQPSKE